VVQVKTTKLQLPMTNPFSRAASILAYHGGFVPKVALLDKFGQEGFPDFLQ